MVELAVALHATPIDMQATQVVLDQEITRLFAPVPDIEKPVIRLVQDNDGVTARMSFADATKMLARYRMIADPTREGKYTAFTDTPELNRVLVSLGMDKGKLFVPYQSADEVGAYIIKSSINSDEAIMGSIDFVQGPDGPFHTMTPDVMIMLDGVARFRGLGEWDAAHVSRIRDLGLGLAMIRSPSFDKTGDIAQALQDGFSDDIFEPEEALAEDNLDTSFADRLAASRAKAGTGRAIGGGERHGPAHVVDMQGKTWKGRTEGSGE